MKTKPLLTIACSLLLVSCGDDETPSTPAAARENALPTLDPECYEQALKYEISEGKKSMEEFSSAAENGKFGEYLAASDAREAQSDLDMCRRYAACDDVSDEKRQAQTMQCTNQRLRQRMKDMGY
jgi:hypothetical protein